MDTWFSVNLGDGITAGALLTRIEEKYAAIYAKKKSPTDMAVFTRHDFEGSLHCEVTAYFSPAAIEIAKEFQARPCIKPDTQGLNLLAGSEISWTVLFNNKSV